MKKIHTLMNMSLLTVFVLGIGLTAPAYGLNYFGYEEWGGTWHDAEKSHSNTDDDLLCWAAAASNIIDWGGWGTTQYDSEQNIFGAYQTYWTDEGGSADYAWNWWFDGSEPSSGWGGSTVDKSGGGNYWSDYVYDDYSFANWWSQSLSMEFVDQYLHDGWGVTLGITRPNQSLGHALTVWGYEYDDAGNYNGIWVTDSDDYTTNLKLLSLTYDATNEWWNLSGEGYDNWYIRGVYALNQREDGVDPVDPDEPVDPGNPVDPIDPVTTPVPEPGTFVLMLSGIFLAWGVKKIRRR